MRSVLTGGLVRMAGDAHPRFDGWDGIGPSKARRKTPDRIASDQRASEVALSGRPMPSKPSSNSAARFARPSAWSYNASRYAPLIRRSLAPWYDGQVTASAVDMAYWHEMYLHEPVGGRRSTCR